MLGAKELGWQDNHAVPLFVVLNLCAEAGDCVSIVAYVTPGES